MEPPVMRKPLAKDCDIKVDLLPGMPAKVQIETVRRDVTSYFLKPLADQMSRSFREG